jgi:flavodoxin
MKANHVHFEEGEAPQAESRHWREGGMKNAVVIYDSVFGNTKKIAKALAFGISKHDVPVDCFKVDEIDIQNLVEYDLLAIGGPTHMLSLSKHMKEFLETLKTVNLNGKKGFCFDTRNNSRFNRFDVNSAAKRIEKKLKRMKVVMIAPRKSAIVEGREGPLDDNMEEMFAQYGEEIVAHIQ